MATSPSPSPPASSSVTPSKTELSWYGHELVSRSAAAFITDLFNCPSLPPLSPNASSRPTTRPPLANFIAYALHRTKLPKEVTTASLCLLERLKRRFPAAKGSSGHRLFICAFMMSSKLLCDDTYSNKSWSIVGQHLFTLSEVNQMEREMLAYLEWNVKVEGEEVAALDQRLESSYAPVLSPSRSITPAVVPFTFVTPPLPPPTPTTSSSSPTTASTSAVSSSSSAAAAAALAYPSPPTSPSYTLSSVGVQPQPIFPQHAQAAHGGHPSPLSESFHSGASSSPGGSLGECRTPEDVGMVGVGRSKGELSEVDSHAA